MPRKKKVLLALTEVEGRGGIQTLGRLVIRALSEDFELSVISLNDEQSTTLPDLPPVRGFARNKVRFSLECLRRASRSDLVFIGHPNFASLVLFIRSTPTTVLIYGVDGWGQANRMNIAGLKSASSLIAISQYTMRRTKSALGLTPREAHVLHPALDPQRAGQPHLRVPVPQRILTVTRLDPADRYKGVDAVLRVVQRLTNEFPRLRYRIVGGGRDIGYYKNLISALRIEERVDLLGFLEDDQLRDEYSKAHLFVLPSSSEGFGLVYLEAMSWGVPVVGSAAGATPEALDGGNSGVLVGEGDLDQLEAELRRLLSDDNAALQLSINGNEWVRSAFTFEHFKKRTVELISDLAVRS